MEPRKVELVSLPSNTFDLFQNISQFYFRDVSFDFHNDFNCEQVIFENHRLCLVFSNTENKSTVSLCFQDTTITYCQFDFTAQIESLTIDNLYRGRFEIDASLIEFDNDRSYFYLEFCEGPKLEFWCESIRVEMQADRMKDYKGASYE